MICTSLLLWFTAIAQLSNSRVVDSEGPVRLIRMLTIRLEPKLVRPDCHLHNPSALIPSYLNWYTIISLVFQVVFADNSYQYSLYTACLLYPTNTCEYTQPCLFYCFSKSIKSPHPFFLGGGGKAIFIALVRLRKVMLEIQFDTMKPHLHYG